MDRNQNIIALKNRGLTPAKICLETKLTKGQVMGVLHRAGLTERRPKTYPDYFKRQVVQEYFKTSLKDAALKFGVSEGQIHIWRNAGVF